MHRAFWPVYKAEHELLPKISLRPSGIEMFMRIDFMFPLLPSIEPYFHDFPSKESRSRAEEKNREFYLAEISFGAL